LEKINTDPNYIMDIILNNIRTERTLWGWSWDEDSDKYRILSYGPPSSTGQFRDTLGRNWITAHWNIVYNNRVLLMYILPLPNGPVLITTMGGSTFIKECEIDIQKICEHLFTAYEATFAEWVEFINYREFIPEFLNYLSFEWKTNDQSFIFSCGSISIRSDKQTFNWTNDSKLYLFPFWYKNKNNMEFGISGLLFDRDFRGNDYFSLFLNVKPDSRLGTVVMERWNDLVLENHPFNRRPVISVSNNTGSIGAIIHTPHSDTEIIFSLYLSIKDPINEENILRRINTLKQGIYIRE